MHAESGLQNKINQSRLIDSNAKLGITPIASGKKYERRLRNEPYAEWKPEPVQGGLSMPQDLEQRF